MQEPIKFQFEKVKEVPPSGGGGGRIKYDWSTFPAPDPKTGEKAVTFIEGVGYKSISNSIKKFKDKMAKEGKPVPEFELRTVKADKEKGIKGGVKVYRTA